MSDEAKVRESVYARTAELRTITEAEDVAFQLDVVDLIVGGASMRQIAETYSTTLKAIRVAYRCGLERLVDKSADRSMMLREEITARQRSLVLANLARAKLGDRNAAVIVQKADALLASIWGLRSLRVDVLPPPGDPAIAAALDGYLAGLAENTGG